MSMQVSHGALPLIMGNYASKFGVNLFMYGNSAYTDGKNITIPRLDFENEEEMEMAFGYVAHECGHIRFSDFGSIKRAIDESSWLMNLFNALEDVRIEYLQSRDWPGLTKSFSFLVEKLEGDIVRCIRKTDDLTSLIIIYFSAFGRFNCLKQPSRKSLRAASKKLSSYLPETLISYLNGMVLRITRCKNSDEVLDIAQQITNIVRKFVERINDDFNKKECRQSAGDSAVTGDDATHTGCLQDAENRFREQFNEFQRRSLEKGCGVQLSCFDFDNAGFNTGLNDDFYSGLSEYGCSISGDDVEKMESELSTIVAGMKEEYPGVDGHVRAFKVPCVDALLEKTSRNSPNARDIGSLVVKNSKPADNLDLYHSVLSDNSLRCNISSLVKGYESWHLGNNSHGRVLDVRAYYNSMEGKLTDRIFKRKVMHRAVNTTFHLLVDISGSMSRECERGGKCRYEVANHMALSLALAMEGVRNLDLRVAYFPGNFCEYEEVYRTGQPLVERATYFDLRPRGCTPLAQTLLSCISQMPDTDRYHRNIIVVITDGEPDNYSFAESMIAKAEAKGIEIHALRVSDRLKLRDLFNSCIDVKDASELPKAMTELLADRIFAVNV